MFYSKLHKNVCPYWIFPLRVKLDMGHESFNQQLTLPEGGMVTHVMEMLNRTDPDTTGRDGHWLSSNVDCPWNTASRSETLHTTRLDYKLSSHNECLPIDIIGNCPQKGLHRQLINPPCSHVCILPFENSEIVLTLCLINTPNLYHDAIFYLQPPMSHWIIIKD